MGNGEIGLSSDSFNDGVPTKVAAASTWGSTGNVEERRSVLDMEYNYGILLGFWAESVETKEAVKILFSLPYGAS